VSVDERLISRVRSAGSVVGKCISYRIRGPSFFGHTRSLVNDKVLKELSFHNFV